MSSAKVNDRNRLNGKIDKVVESYKRVLDTAVWTAREGRVRLITVDGHESVLIG